MDERLRRSAAHVLVPDLSAPVADDPTIHHLVRVLRLGNGEPVSATDGRGNWRPCVLSSRALVAAGAVVETSRPATLLTVAVAPPKGERLDWLVAKCTEVGVDRIIFVDAERSVVRWVGDRAERQLQRLRRVAAEASMQSRRVWLPVVEGPVAATAALHDAVVAEPGGRALTGADTVVAIGPEGGWSAGELSSAHDTVSLGSTILRVETAAVAAAVLMVAARAGGAS